MKVTGGKIGLFGGTFDPVHIGHLIIAESVGEYAGLDTVIFIPSANPPHKSSDMMFSAEERFKMLSLAVNDNPRFVVSDVEMKRDGPSYTIDTIKEMKAAFPQDTELLFILGMDNLFEIDLWKNPHEIIKECKLLVARRVCDECGEIPVWLKEYVEMVDVPLIGISSSDIRRRIKNGESIRYLVPDAAVEVIDKGFGTCKKE